MSVKYTAGQLVKMGKFKEAIPLFGLELHLALERNLIRQTEMLCLVQDFNHILLNPSDYDQVQKVGDKMLMLEMRLPGYLQPVTREEFYKNIKLNYETFDTNDK